MSTATQTQAPTGVKFYSFNGIKCPACINLTDKTLYLLNGKEVLSGIEAHIKCWCGFEWRLDEAETKVLSDYFKQNDLIFFEAEVPEAEETPEEPIKAQEPETAKGNFSDFVHGKFWSGRQLLHEDIEVRFYLVGGNVSTVGLFNSIGMSIEHAKELYGLMASQKDPFEIRIPYEFYAPKTTRENLIANLQGTGASFQYKISSSPTWSIYFFKWENHKVLINLCDIEELTGKKVDKVSARLLVESYLFHGKPVEIDSESIIVDGKIYASFAGDLRIVSSRNELKKHGDRVVVWVRALTKREKFTLIKSALLSTPQTDEVILNALFSCSNVDKLDFNAMNISGNQGVILDNPVPESILINAYYASSSHVSLDITYNELKKLEFDLGGGRKYNSSNMAISDLLSTGFYPTTWMPITDLNGNMLMVINRSRNSVVSCLRRLYNKDYMLVSLRDGYNVYPDLWRYCFEQIIAIRNMPEKEWLEKYNANRMKYEEELFVKIGTITRQKRREGYVAAMTSSANEINIYKQKLVEQIRIFDDNKNNLTAVDSIEELKPEKFREKFQAFSKIRGYTSFEITKEAIIGTTQDVIITYDGEDYNFGKIGVVIYYNSGRIRCIKKGDNLRYSNYFHPHISSDNVPCLGNFELEIPNLIARYEFDVCFINMFRFLESYNNNSPYTNIGNFEKE